MNRESERTPISRRSAIQKMAGRALATASLSSIPGCQWGPKEQPPSPSELIVQNGRVIDLDQDQIQDIRVLDGTIAELGTNLKSTRELSRTIDATDR